MPAALPAFLAVIGMGLLYGQLSALWAGVLLLVNSASLGAFALDKQRAERQRGKRIPEDALHLLAVFGGAGACIGRSLFNHKTQKPAFSLSTGAGAALLWVLALHSSLTTFLRG